MTSVTATQIPLIALRMSKLSQNKPCNIDNHHLTYGHAVKEAEGSRSSRCVTSSLICYDMACYVVHVKEGNAVLRLTLALGGGVSFTLQTI
jgi:hypothetical protein